MGIKGLAKLIYENKARICTAPGPLRGELIVDGYGILHELYSSHSLDWTNGGCYAQQHQVTLGYFQALVESGARPIVVVDGGGSREQLQETLYRRNRNIVNLPKMIEEGHRSESQSHMMPILARDVFVSSLRDSGIDVYVADGNARKTIVYLANYYQCPILTNNSTYCICNVEGGVIFFSHLDISTCQARVCKQTDLIKFCGLRNPELLYAVVAILGDGCEISVPFLYHGRIRGQIQDSLKGVDHKGRSWVLNVIDFLRLKRITSFEEVKHSQRSLNFGRQYQKFLENCLKVESVYMEKYYLNPNTISTDELFVSTTLRCSKPCEIPLPIIQGFRKGTFPLLALDAMTTGECVLEQCVGDLDQPPVSTLGLPVRQLIYGFTSSLMKHGGKTHINEYYRNSKGEDLRYEAHVVFPVVKYEELMITDLYCKADKSKRALAVQAICEVLRCPEAMVHELETNVADQSLVLVTLVTRFWGKYLTESQQLPNPEQLIKAVVVNFFLNLSDPGANRQRDIDVSRYSHPEWIKVYHALLEWLSLYRSVCYLNAVLCKPFKPRSSCFLFDGPLIFFLALHVSPEIIDTYQRMISAEKKEQCCRLFEFVV